MNMYSLLHGEEIHCNGVLMSPEEIILKLQKADMLADMILQGTIEDVKVPAEVMNSKQAFVKWINEH